MAESPDNDEDLQELEVRLYGQVHHDAVDEKPVITETKASEEASRANIDKETGNVAGNNNRYWNKGDKSTASQHRKFTKVTMSASGTPLKSPGAAATQAAVTSEFKSPADPGATLSASGGSPEKKRSPNPFNKIKIQNKSDSKNAAPTNNDRPGNFLDRKMRRLEQKKKIVQKRIKSATVRGKMKTVTETIVLDTSDEDEDVVVIPMPSPPIVTVDSSDEDGEVREKESSARQTLSELADDQKSCTGNSRCNSPNSVMSDDFIGQQDKRRLLDEAPEDVDMAYNTVDKETGEPSEEPPCNEPASALDGFAAPTKRVSKSTKESVLNYEVTQTNFRALDVYESESSDMPESVYAKGSKPHPGTANKSDDSDVEEVESVAKTKRLRKRKASGSCRSSEYNDDTSDSEEADASATGLSYVSRGEAIENCKQKAKKRTISIRENVNADDREFIDKLSNIVHGSKDDHDESVESIASPEPNITAREIAEDVLKQTSDTGDQQETAIPSAAIVDMDLLNVIDSINTQLDDYVEPPRHGGVASNELYFEDLTKKDASKDPDDVCMAKNRMETATTSSPKHRKEDKLSFMHVAYTNRDHVAWNEEMVRFYDFSWGQEKFNVDRVLRLMDRKADWHISNADRFPKARKFSNLKCNNCCEYGHPMTKCPLPRKDLICYACGDIGHKEPRCPNAMCLRCGKKTNVFTRSCHNCIMDNVKICPICRIRGHSIDLCPDRWRRYHSTKNVNEHPNSNVVYNEDKHCCICARRGHLPEQCRSFNKLNEYHAPTTEIRYHSKTYGDVDAKDILEPGVIGVHLMCDPSKTVKFPFAEKVTRDQYYGRFLDSVGLLDDPKSKVVINYVLNPFAKNAKHEKFKTIKQVLKRKRPNEEQDDIQMNVTGMVDLDAEAHGHRRTNSVDAIEIDDNTLDGNTERVPGRVSKTGADSNVAGKIDTDSNYSFSEHFPSSEATGDDETTSSINKKKNVDSAADGGIEQQFKIDRKKKLGTLPDYIALNDSDDEGCEADDKMIEQSNDNAENEPEEPCEGKIYLSKFYSQFLLSPAGTEFLVNISKQHNMKVVMDWSSAGNVLRLKGLPSDQNKFYKDYTKKMKEISDNKNRNTLESSQKLPRSREALISFLQESILELEKRYENPTEILKKIKYNESHFTKSSFRIAEKNRRALNTVLMGQGGLRDGLMHLSMLQDKLRQLKLDKSEKVPDELREEIDQHHRYIFSSHQHENYEQLIRQYMSLKAAGKLPDLNLNYKLLGKKVLNTTLSEEQKQNMNRQEGRKFERKQKDERIESKFRSPRTEFGEFIGKPRDFNPSRVQPQDDRHRDGPYGQQQFKQPNPDYGFAKRSRTAPPPPPYISGSKYREQGKPPNFLKRQFDPPPGISGPNRSDFHGKTRNFPKRQLDPPPLNPGVNPNFQRPVAKNKLQEISKKWDRRMVIEENVRPEPQKPKQMKKASSYWSQECLKVISRILGLPHLQQSITEKLNLLSERASKGLLSFNDFKAVKKIYFNLLKTQKTPT